MTEMLKGSEAARQRALKVIAQRETCVQPMKLNFKSYFSSFGPEGESFHGHSLWQPEVWDNLPPKEKALWLKQWEHVERLLPVYYEFARQSVHVLHLAGIHATIMEEMPDPRPSSPPETSKPRLGGVVVHPLEQLRREGIRELHERIGGYAEALILNLGKFLANDVPYPTIPINERKWAAALVLRCNKQHVIMGPMLTDAGPVRDPWTAGQVERDVLRLARTEEATQTAAIQYQALISASDAGESIHHQDVITFDKALRATTQDGYVTNTKTKQREHRRAFDHEGGEVLAIKVRWEDTRDAELAEAFLKLVKSLRPRKPESSSFYRFQPEADFPERPASQMRGRKWQTEAMAALRALVELQRKRALTNAWRAAKAEVARLRSALKRPGLKKKEQEHLQSAIHRAMNRAAELSHQSKSSAHPGKKRAIATACFRKVAGADERAWWEKK